MARQISKEIRCESGTRLMLDLFSCPKDKLSDAQFLFKALNALPAEIGLARMLPPNVFKYSGGTLDEWGMSGVLILDQFHVSAHTFPDKEHAFIDIFSSKNINIEFATNYFVQLFSAGRHEATSVQQAAGAEVDWVGAAVTPRIFH